MNFSTATISRYLFLEALVISVLSLVCTGVWLMLPNCWCAPNDFPMEDGCMNATMVDNKMTTYPRICKTTTLHELGTVFFAFIGLMYVVWRIFVSSYKFPVPADQ